jgi:hypothetical protein
VSTQSISSRRENLGRFADEATTIIAKRYVEHYKYMAGNAINKETILNLLKIQDILRSGICALSANESQMIYEYLINIE